MLQALNYFLGPSLDLIQYDHVLVPKTSELDPVADPQLDRVVTQPQWCWADRRSTSFDILKIFLLIQIRMISFSQEHVAGSCSLFFSPRSPGPFVQSCFPAGKSQFVMMHGLFLIMCRTSYFPLLNSIRFLMAWLSSLSQSLWMVAQSILVDHVSTTLLHFAHSTDFGGQTILGETNRTKYWGFEIVELLHI